MVSHDMRENVEQLKSTTNRQQNLKKRNRSQASKTKTSSQSLRQTRNRQHTNLKSLLRESGFVESDKSQVFYELKQEVTYFVEEVDAVEVVRNIIVVYSCVPNVLADVHSEAAVPFDAVVAYGVCC